MELACRGCSRAARKFNRAAHEPPLHFKIINYQNIYAIGDIQGCYQELQALLKLIKFDRTRDQLWLVGDLVNRGPQSLDVLRFIKDLGPHAITVLGNHDLHLLAVAYGTQALARSDTLDDILSAPDCVKLIEWLQQQPLLHHDAKLNYTMVHAGIPPQWDLISAQNFAYEVESILKNNPRDFFKNMYGNEPCEWSDELVGFDRLRYIVNAFTRLRFCTRSGKLELKTKETAVSPTSDLLPWFKIPERKTKHDKIIFGHWAALEGKANTENIFALDTGCVWGGKLTALRLSDEQLFSAP